MLTFYTNFLSHFPYVGTQCENAFKRESKLK